MKKVILVILLCSLLLTGCSYLLADIFPKKCPHGIETRWGNICEECREGEN